MDIDAVFNARFLAVDQILKFVRGKTFNAISSFAECDAEALELVPEEGSPITKYSLKEIKFPANLAVHNLGTPQDYSTLELPKSKDIISRLICIGISCTWKEDELAAYTNKIIASIKKVL